MKTAYVARQPIFNRKKNTIGYELLFRDGEDNSYPSHIEPNRATYRLIVENFLSVGSNPNILWSRSFINFPYESLIRLLPLSLPKNKVVIEVLESCEPTEELLGAIRMLHKEGYIIALDDFTFGEDWKRFMPYVHIIKLDVMALGIDKACQLVKEHVVQRAKYRFLAERIETEDQFQQAKKAGFRFFQGFFFSKPEMVRTRYVSPEQAIAIELFKEVCRQTPNFDNIEKIISQDAVLSYKLLNFVNSQSPRLEVAISSFRQALIYLGQDKLKMFVSLVVASYISTNKPRELFNLSLQRAQFCELMSRKMPFIRHQEQGYMIGLLSILDAMLDLSVDSLVNHLPLTDIAKQALLSRQGDYGTLIALEECFEQANWQGVEDLTNQLGLSITEVHEELMSAQRWAHELTL